MRAKKSGIDPELPVLEHLAELRRRLIIIAVSIIACTSILYFFAPRIARILFLPVAKFHLELAFFSPTEAFVTRVKLALIASVILVNPLIFYQIGAFILPGLTETEKHWLTKLLIRIVPLFSGGVCFGYWIITPIISDLLITFGQSYMTPVLSGDKYLSFVALFTVINGLLFIMPVIIVQLGKMGLLDSAKLKKGRKYLLVSLVVLETLIGSLNDPLSLLALSLPLVILYEISIPLVRWKERKKSTAVL
jgi:sec-independent protein translocase protein TatC